MAPRGRNQPSGWENRKKKERREEVMKSQIGNMLRYVTRTPIPRTDETARPEAEIGKEDEGLNNMEENADEKSIDNVVDDDAYHMNENRDKAFESENRKEAERVDEIRVLYENVDMTDPANWENIDQKMRDYLVEKGPPPKPRADYSFPRDDIDRCFTYSSYIRRMTNGEKQVRRWLVYSKVQDKVFCFCCKLFDQETNPIILLASSGFNDWRNASQRLKRHETTHRHIICMTRWMELEERFQKNKVIDNHMQEAIKKEKKHWRDVLLRIIAVVKTLAEQNLAFRCYPNAWIGYRILLTIPVSVASAERSFSKLKLIKNYLRSTMSQDRLNGLALISIEQEQVEKLDYQKMMNDFAGMKAKRIIFRDKQN